MNQILSRSHNYELFLAENFKGFDYWEIIQSSSFINRLKVTSKNPNYAAFNKETSLFNFSNSKKSLMLHTYLEIPFRNIFYLQPRSKIKIPLGDPVQFIFWVHSNHYQVSMKLILFQQDNPETIVDLGKLNFKGWKRIKKKIYIFKRNQRENLIYQKPFYLEKIYFQPHRSQKKGDFILYFSRMMFLIDKTKKIQTNIQIKDNW